MFYYMRVNIYFKNKILLTGRLMPEDAAFSEDLYCKHFPNGFHRILLCLPSEKFFRLQN